MCLAVPMVVVETRDDGWGVCDLDGIRREVNISLVDAVAGDYVIVHAGFAIEKLDRVEADARIAMFEELAAAEESGNAG
jgi:hydrogenase expression/formation protein HypC